MRWEYQTMKMKTKGLLGGILEVEPFDEMLNTMGQEGWELVAIFDTNMSEGATREVVATFKRPRG